MTAHTTDTKTGKIEGAKGPYVVLYDWGTPNGHKVTIFLEALGIDYYVRPIDLSKKVQKEDWFLKKNPNGKIPTLEYVDTKGESELVSESSAIMIYLSDKFDTKREFSFSPETKLYYEVLEWLFFQTSGLAANKGQWHFWKLSGNAPETPFAINRFYSETLRLLSVLDKRLEINGTGYLVSDHVTLADMATYPWLLRKNEKLIEDLKQYKHLSAWLDKLSALPAFKAGSAIP